VQLAAVISSGISHECPVVSETTGFDTMCEEVVLMQSDIHSMFDAGCDFLAPVCHHGNTLVIGPDSYRFGDYRRLGLLLSIRVIVFRTPSIAWIAPRTAGTAYDDVSLPID
jgi:hypothetical protein